MELTEIADIARSFSVLVRIHGPDPKGLKMRKHAFHVHESGRTTLSASGLLLAPDSSCASPIVELVSQGSCEPWCTLILTVASVVEPFLPANYREDPVTQVLPKLIPGTQVDILVECKKASNYVNGLYEETPKWHPAQLLALVNVPSSSQTVHSLLEAEGSLLEHGAWDVGWSLAPSSSSAQSVTGALQKKLFQVRDETKSLHESQMFPALGGSSSQSSVASSITRIALLGISSINSKDLSQINVATRSKRGDLLVAMGSPFGILSPFHFLNSVFVGAVSNCCPPGSCSSLLMADLQCLPGMEGGPVFGDNARLIGILTRPLKQRAGGAEVQLVITWDAIETAIRNQLKKEPEMPMKIKGLYIEKKMLLLGHSDSQGSKDDGFDSPLKYSHAPYAKVLPSIVLVTVGDGTWASGVILNSHGLILTNAHLLEPWRFNRTNLFSQRNGTTMPSLSTHFENLVPKKEANGQKLMSFDASLGKHLTSARDYLHKSYRRMRVRLDHVEPRIWCDARVVYISKGPIDIALLQLDNVPVGLCPIVPHFICPSPGSKVHVIGHGLFGPRSGLLPSISSGVVAKVVQTQIPLIESGARETEVQCSPIMIETTAAVYPGVSGGAVVNSDGLMIGLVTSNARHSGGTLIPHLNFSIPCAALKPVFEFSKVMQDLSILQAMDEPNEVLSSVWALKEPPLRSVPKALLPQALLEKNNEGKGTRFAKFLAEKQAEISQDPSPSQIQSIKPFKSSVTPQSKLSTRKSENHFKSSDVLQSKL